jgi:hypothetical protein
MTYFSALDATAQIIERLLLLAAGYLAFVLFALVCMVLWEIISERSDMVRANSAESKVQKSGWLSEIEGRTNGVRSRWSIIQHQLPRKIS